MLLLTATSALYIMDCRLNTLCSSLMSGPGAFRYILRQSLTISIKIAMLFILEKKCKTTSLLLYLFFFFLFWRQDVLDGIPLLLSSCQCTLIISKQFSPRSLTAQISVPAAVWINCLPLLFVGNNNSQKS